MDHTGGIVLNNRFLSRQMNFKSPELKQIFLVTILALVLPRAAAGATTEPETPDAPVISVITFGPGVGAFVAFGHNAFRIRDPHNHTDLIFNFGTFRFDTPLLIVDFLMGRFKYWLGVKPYYDMVNAYKRENRWITEQVLDLSPEMSRRLADALKDNAKPENRVYLYNYYRDNCSTRVRDAIDRLFGGQLKAQFEVPGKMTLRQHSLRATADNLPVYLGIDIVLGDTIDRPETVWQEMFLPEVLMEGLGKATVKGEDGVTRPLVKETRVVHPGEGGPRMRKAPPKRAFDIFLLGLAVAVMVSVLAYEAFRSQKRWARVLFGLVFGLFGLFAGLLGTLFTALWMFTDHDPAYRNENILQCAPWAILFVGGAWGILRNKARLENLAFYLAASAFGASLLGLALKVLPFMDQDNRRIIAFFLPVWTALLAGAVLMRRSEKRTEVAVPPEKPPVKNAVVVKKRSPSKSKKKRR
jgi:uncharacterized membrane protein YedE/YeeE